MPSAPLRVAANQSPFCGSYFVRIPCLRSDCTTGHLRNNCDAASKKRKPRSSATAAPA